jgi:hypothetical protein
MAKCLTGHRKILLSLVLIIPLLAILVATTPVLAAPVVIIAPTTGAVGTDIVIQGNNFNSYTGDNISITFDTTEIPTSPLEVPESGNFTTELTIPNTATAGRHWITVYSTGSPVSMLARNFFIVEEQLIALDVTAGFVGTEVNIAGQGFYSNRAVSIYYYNVSGEKLGSVTSSPIGRFDFNFTVPHSTGGTHNITALNDKGNQAEASFTVIPQAFLNQTAAGPGELITLGGTGFGYRSQVSISLGSHPIGTVRTSDRGDFEIVFNTPEVKPGVYEIKSTDEYYNQAKIQFTVTANVSLSNASGAVGSSVTINGSGFSVQESVTIDYDGATVATTATDYFGKFSVSFNIPASQSGSHIITVSDGIFTRQLTFTVEAEVPPAPVPLLPAQDTETRSLAYFDWQDVTDPSTPVVYRLQVASDRNFSSIVLDIAEIAASEYNLTADESLPAVKTDTPYYWRVKAKDSADNESEWSEPWSFNVSTPPAPDLIQPDLDSRVEAPIFFNWQDVTSLDPPVTYRFQIGTDLGFSSVLLERIGLEESEYYLSEEDNLPKAGQDVPYYWRVKAVDNAQNEGEWSNPRSFYYESGFSFPSWAIYTLIGLAVVLVGYLAYWVGRRTAFKPTEED